MSLHGRWLPALLGLGAASIAGCYTPTVARTQSYHPSDADLSVTRIVHGSAVIEFPETRLLLDPWYSPTPPLGPAEAIGLSLENLPPMRGLLITHKHDDHFDAETLREFPNKSLRVVVPRGLGAELARMGYSDVVEIEDWETAQIGSVVVTAVPARHRVAENGYVLQGNSLTVYVAGDTSFDADLFHSILGRFPQLDAALLPIGGIRILSRRLDMTPEEAADAFAILKPGHVIPYHYGLTGPMPFVTAAANPVKRLYEAMGKTDKGSQNAIVALDPGESWHHYR
ncbi:MAG: MBL fold metallo-hydrolase [Deltaproteobacteria bacterium]|nr:MBL fold metallo-hydrolase [Deltaproteobacteria bacterium]